jgi:hypothetical protein
MSAVMPSSATKAIWLPSGEKTGAEMLAAPVGIFVARPPSAGTR